MAATDQNYRNQYMLDVVFAVSSILLLVSIVVMLAVEQGYMSLGEANNKRWKEEQRVFRDVEVAMAQREALKKLPSLHEVEMLIKQADAAKVQRKKNQEKIDEYDRQIRAKLPAKEAADLELTNLKAFLDSKKSFYDIEVEHAKSATAPTVVRYKNEVEDLQQKVGIAKDKADALAEEVKVFQRKKDDLERPLTEAIGNLKKTLDDFDRQVNLATKKQWGVGDWIRSLPVIDGFAAPTKIEQFTINDLTIDYNFKGVTRFDRCTTCHKGIDRANYTRENLEALWYEPEGDARVKDKLKDAKKILELRQDLLAGLDEGRNLPDVSKLSKLKTMSPKRLTPARVSEFCAHPRLDLFVSPTSKHPQEKFGCTSCHSGQPSATAFALAAHTPNDAATMKRWTKEHDWESQHMWDFPMLPNRFIESACLKCHHQVTDLYSNGNKSEAPKLTKGHSVISEFGCFGCHEINGYKSGRQVGPDMRLEPSPPLESLSPAEQAKLRADPDNPPGQMRKVGPSLYRLGEKTYKEWAVKWLKAPREFRPDTKMPHYFGLSNNDEKALAGTGQEDFPDTEIQGIAHYLFSSSRDYLDMVKQARNAGLVKEKQDIVQPLQEKLDRKEKLTEAETKKLLDAKYFLSLQSHPERLSDEALKMKGDATKGRDLFTRKGCLACHSHAATNEPGDGWPAAPSEAEFGPNLSQVKEKLVNKEDKDSGDRARIWLFNWLKNPSVHNPRTRMPITHLSDQEATDIAAWLLSRDVPRDPGGKVSEDIQGAQWESLKVATPDRKKLEKLVRVYLDPLLADSEIKQLFNGQLAPDRAAALGADERELVQLFTGPSLKWAMEQRKIDEQEAKLEQLKWYVGKKAIGRLGCYGCHDIPGFDNAKPIGTALAEWGKKDPGRLAFEDIANFMKDHFKEKQIVDKRVDEDGNPLSLDKGRPLYEKYFFDALLHGARDGYLHQKIYDPRSYDYNRLRSWTDRSRMPLFKFARVKKKQAETEQEFQLRKDWAEAKGQPLSKSDKARAAESSEAFAARKDMEEANAREAVMTFVLGLVAEPIPLQYLNAPSPDRLAEIKGRQVLDKFNCAGCHTVRPGAVEFKLSPSLVKRLDNAWNPKGYKTDYHFHDHSAWYPPKIANGTVLTHVATPGLDVDGKKPVLKVTLSEAILFKSGTKDSEGDLDRNFRAGDEIKIPASDVIWPPPGAFKNPDTFRAWEKQFGPQGGAFAKLLSAYLTNEKYPIKDLKGKEFGMVPPHLMWEGERVQPNWLFQFLRDPHKVREMAVLRMPKFNMSQDEAEALVNYFAAVAKRDNPNNKLIYPYVNTPQSSDLTSDYWKGKTQEYIQKLKDAKVYNPEKKMYEDAKLYETEKKTYEASWEKMHADWKVELKAAQTRKKAAYAALKVFMKEEQDVKEAADLLQGPIVDRLMDQLKQKQLDRIKIKKEPTEQEYGFWSSEKDRLDVLVTQKPPAELQKDWADHDAYALAGFRLVINKCNQCHDIGYSKAQNQAALDPKVVQGPSLNLASKRLQPGWVHYWVANPQRFVPYPTLMPVNFAADKSTAGVAWMPDEPLFMVDSARDTVLNLQTITAYPLTRYFMQIGPGEATKTGK
jgi:mono/diheme cytochrome c family protein